MTTKLGYLIRSKREAKGLNQVEFAKAVKVEQQTVSRWETGDIKPPITRLPVLADVLGVDRNDLFEASAASTSRPQRSNDRKWKVEVDQRIRAIEELLVESFYPSTPTQRPTQRSAAGAAKKAQGHRAGPLKARKAGQ